MREFPTNFDTLANGVRVLKIEVPNDDLTAISVYVDTGSRNDIYTQSIGQSSIQRQKGKYGLAHQVEHAVFKGTAYKSERQLNIDADSLPADWSASTDDQMTIYYMETLGSRAKKAIDLLSEILSFPSFPRKPVLMEKQVIKQEIRNYRDDEPSTILEKWKELLYKGSSIARPILGTRSSVDSTTRKNVIDFYNQFYTGNRMLVALAGNVDGLDDHIAGSFGRIKPGASETFEGSAGYGKPGKVVITKNSTQAHFVIGVPGVPINDDRYYPLKIVEYILGGHSVTTLDMSLPSSRLYEALRVKNGIAYEVTCSVSAGKDTGYLAVQGQVEPQLLSLTLEMVKDEMLSLSSGITEAEFERAKTFWELYFLKVIKNNLSLAYLMGQPALYYNSVVQPAEIIRRIKSVKQEDVIGVAQELLTEDQLRLAVLGPFNKNLHIIKK